MISQEIQQNLKNASWIRRMFVEGAKLKAERGEDNVYDYSLGNPYFEPPQSVVQAFRDAAASEELGTHRYMDNLGYVATRQKIADDINASLEKPISATHVMMTVGAAGGMNTLLRTILATGEEVIVFAPYFAEYLFYIRNHNGVPRIVRCDEENFEPNLAEFEAAIHEKTRAVIINTPNNPTGAVYSEEMLRGMAKILAAKEAQFGKPIYLISDEPYAAVVYDGVQLPNVHNIFHHSVIVNSYSKSLGLAGERIGYVAINSTFEEPELFMAGLSFANRTLGFVNAPAIWQRVIANSSSDTVDIALYDERRKLLLEILREAGIDVKVPKGAFYLFPRSLEEDDVAFVLKAKDFGLLLVPGSGFGYPGYFRLSYCADLAMIERSRNAFKQLADYYRNR